MLDSHAQMHGFHAYLSGRHGALFTEDDRTLLVTFEEAATIRARENRLPFGLEPAGRSGWSHLCLYCEGQTWFRDPGVYALMDDLVDDGFFQRFEQVIFFGVGQGGYAAAAYSIAAPGANVVAIRPQATLDPEIAGWDPRFPEARRLDFRTRYGYAPQMLEPAGQVALIYDPRVPLDAMHAALFTRPNVDRFRVPFFGPAPEDMLGDMRCLVPILQLAARDRLDRMHFAEVVRKRQSHPAYLRAVLDHLEAADRPRLAGMWARAVTRFSDRPRFHEALGAAMAKLEERGLTLPDPRRSE